MCYVCFSPHLLRLAPVASGILEEGIKVRFCGGFSIKDESLVGVGFGAGRGSAASDSDRPTEPTHMLRSEELPPICSCVLAFWLGINIIRV